MEALSVRIFVNFLKSQKEIYLVSIIVIVMACTFLVDYSGNSLSVGDYIVVVIMTSM